MSIKNNYLSNISSNKGYLAVSFFVALSLWVVMIGKKDTTMVKHLKVVFVTEKGLSVIKASSEEVLVKLVGPRISILKMRSISDSLTIDVKDLSPGAHKVSVPKNSLSLPVGVKIRDVSPKVIWVKVQTPITKESFE